MSYRDSSCNGIKLQSRIILSNDILPIACQELTDLGQRGHRAAGDLDGLVVGNAFRAQQLQSGNVVAGVDRLDQDRLLILSHQLAECMRGCLFARAEILREQPAVATEEAGDDDAIDIRVLQADLREMCERERIFVRRARDIDGISSSGAGGHQSAQALLCLCAKNGDLQASPYARIARHNYASPTITDDRDATTSCRCRRWQREGLAA